VLNVVGTESDDNICFERTNKTITIDGVDGSWTAKQVKSIVVDLRGGDDFVSLDSLANGGNQALKEKVTIQSGAGDEEVQLSGDEDVSLSGPGNELVVAAKGQASLNGAVLNLSDNILTKFKKGKLIVTGTNGDDSIAFRRIGGNISIEGLSGSWAAKKVKSITVNLQAGTNEVSLDSLANGGTVALQETVTINSGAGDQTVHLTDGHDVDISGLGHTLRVTANGTATLDGEVLNWDTPEDPDPPGPDPPAEDWFTTTIQDAALRSLGSTLYVDGVIDRADMLALLQNVQDNNVVDATEMVDLQAIVGNSSLFGLFDYVWKLSTYVVSGNAANAKYQGQTLGDLSAGSTATHLGNLVNKWFLGLDHPVANGTYRQVAGTLFVNGAAYTDVRQGTAGDCYLMASLAEVALLNPNAINNMFIVNGDGTYTVRFYRNGAAEYVSVDSYLPTNNSTGKLLYAGYGLSYTNSSNELWVSMAEKAYVQLHEMGWVRPGLSGNGQNSYAAVNGGYIYAALGHVTGESTVAFTMTGSSTGFTKFVAAFNAGEAIGFATFVNPASSSVVGTMRGPRP
jgi:hypothetical protein